MAIDTSFGARNLVIYQIYVRNHGPKGTFADVEADLERIRSMGVDVVYFMPIHPIGQKNKKGSLGCPYSVADYEAINPEYGTEADFKRLVERVHKLGMKVMIDLVFNHTSHDSRLAAEHPEWFFQDASGKPASKVPDWSDVVDLVYPNPDLEDYLVGVVRDWVAFGVDGFRCDVAPMVPVSFWERARAAAAAVRPGVIWLAESVHASFVHHLRQIGAYCASDSEVYQAFDLTYDYDIFTLWQAAVRGDVPVARYLEMLRFQDGIYPANYAKVRFVENHDQRRIMHMAPTRAQALAWTTLAAFNKGAFFIYAGQEAEAVRQPSLFDVDKVAWGGRSLQDFLARLAWLKKDSAQVNGELVFTAAEPVVQAVWHHDGDSLYGLFNTAGVEGQAAVNLPDGRYINLLDDSPLTVSGGQAAVPASAAVVRCSLDERPKAFFSSLLDHSI